MRDLALHLLAPVVKHADDLLVQVVEGESVTIIEVVLHADDRAALEDDDGRMLRNVRQVLSAAAGSRKATLELVETLSSEE